MYVLHLFWAKELKRCLLHSPIASHSLTTLHCTLKLWLWATAGQHKTPRDSARSAGEQMQADKLLLDHVWSPPGCVTSSMGCWKRSAMESGMFAWQYNIPQSINYTVPIWHHLCTQVFRPMGRFEPHADKVRFKKWTFFPQVKAFARKLLCASIVMHIFKDCACAVAPLCSWKRAKLWFCWCVAVTATVVLNLEDPPGHSCWRIHKFEIFRVWWCLMFLQNLMLFDDFGYCSGIAGHYSRWALGGSMVTNV